jgi:hypothetical protein
MKNISIIILSLLLLTSCSITGPKVIHAPLFKEKGENQIAIYGNSNSGAEVHYDASISNKIFLMSDASLFSYGSAKGLGGSFAVGHYKPLGRNGVFSFYGGNSFSVFGSPLSKKGSQRFFANPYLGGNIGLRTRFFESIFTLRLANHSFWRSGWNNEWTAGVAETAATIRFGGEKVKLHLQAGIFYAFDSQTTGGLIINTGITYRLFKKAASQ